MISNKILKIVFFLVLLSLIFCFRIYILKPRYKHLGHFNIKTDNFKLVEFYRTEPGIHGDKVLVAYFNLNQDQFENVIRYLEKFNPKGISLNKEEYKRYINDKDLENIHERLLNIEKGFYYIIDRSGLKNHNAKSTNYDLIILDVLEKYIYYIEIDS